MKITAEPRSDQINAEDFLGGPRTYTITGVREGTAEQKYDIGLEGEQRVWRPPLTVLRTLIKCWQSDDSADWIGKRVTLYCDEKVTFGKDTVGGIRVSHVSGIDKPATVSVTATRGRRVKVTVQPLADEPSPAQTEPVTEPWQAQWQAISNALTAAGYEGDGPALLTTAGQVIGAEWTHPDQITADQAQKVLAAVREDHNEEN